MAVDPKKLLSSIGYAVDGRGNIRQNMNQLAVITIESTDEGGVLRIHGDPGQFFYNGDPLADTAELSYPVKLTAKYVYFQGNAGELRIELNEFMTNTARALDEYNRVIRRQMAG